MIGIIAGGPGLVAVGLEFKDDDLDAAVWTSPDGIAWSRVPDDDTALGGAGGQSMLSVTVGGPGLVAVGSEASSVNGFSDAAVWTSVDGITWTRVPDDDAVFGDTGDELSHQWILAVTAGGPGLVAVGTDLAGDGGGFDAAVWTSVDGITWSRIPDDGGAFGGDGHESMVSVTIGGPGFRPQQQRQSGSMSRPKSWTRTPLCGSPLMGSPGHGSLTTKQFSAARTTSRW